MDDSLIRRRAFLERLAVGALGISASGCMNSREVEPTAPPVPGLPKLLASQARLYPLMEAEDVYKLIYQATLGPSWFFIGDKSEVEKGLFNEIRQMEPAIHDGETDFELLCEARGLVRVNLRPYLLHGGKASELAHALCLTTQNYRGSRAELKASLDAAVDLLPDLALACDAKKYKELIGKMATANYRPGVHSEPYALAYRPAYRIILQEYLTDAQYGGRKGVYSTESTNDLDRGPRGFAKPGSQAGT